MAESPFQCGNCGALLKSAKEAQEHAELTTHLKINVLTEAVLDPGCTIGGQPCRSKTESDLHTKRTGHAEVADKTSEAAQPISLEVKKEAMETEETVNIAHEEMVVPEVDKNLLEQLEAFGFTVTLAPRALHLSGNTTLEADANFPDIEKLRLERIQIDKELLEAKTIEEDNERKRVISLQKAEEEKVRETILLKLEIEKDDRRRKLGFLPEDLATVKDKMKESQNAEPKKVPNKSGFKATPLPDFYKKKTSPSTRTKSTTAGSLLTKNEATSSNNAKESEPST